MTVEDVEQRVANIDAMKGDYEAAHATEDNLYIDVLKAIAAGADNAPELAKAALEAEKLDFERYCA